MFFDTLALIIMSGFQATGKTTTAKKIYQYSGATLVANHDIRQELTFGNREMYSPEATNAVYKQALILAENELTQGNSVILDAMYLTRARREEAYNLAEKHNALPLIIYCECPSFEVLENRTTARKKSNSPETEGDNLAYYERTKAISESIANDVLPSGLSPIVITFNTVDNTIFASCNSNSTVIKLINILQQGHR